MSVDSLAVGKVGQWVAYWAELMAYLKVGQKAAL
jgi:hypothetical protein